MHNLNFNFWSTKYSLIAFKFIFLLFLIKTFNTTQTLKRLLYFAIFYYLNESMKATVACARLID